MNQTHKQLALLLVFLVSLGVIYVRIFKKPSPNIGVGNAHQYEQPNSSEVMITYGVSYDSVILSSRKLQHQLSSEIEWKRDPFIYGATISQISGLKLSGLLWDDNNPIAIINGQPVKVGETIDGYLVLEIQPQSVSIKADNTAFQLNLE